MHSLQSLLVGSVANVVLHVATPAATACETAPHINTPMSTTIAPKSVPLSACGHVALHVATRTATACQALSAAAHAKRPISAIIAPQSVPHVALHVATPVATACQAPSAAAALG
jgi:hypothetical protein